MAAPYYLTVYDDLGTRQLYRWWVDAGSNLTFTVGVSPANNQTRTYTAYVAQDAPTTGPPVNDVRSPSELSVSNGGWLGTLLLSSNVQTATAQQPSATLTATLDRPLASPYVITVYDDLGNRQLYQNWVNAPTTTSFSFSVSPGLSGTRTYTAYIARDGLNARPKLDVKAVASLAFVSGQLSSPTMQRIDLTWLEGLVRGVSDEELVLTVCASPAATHLQGSSVCDQGLAFTAARAAGKARKWALAAAAAAAGGGSVVLAYVAKQYIVSPPAAPSPTPQQPAPPAPSKPDTLIPPVPIGIGGLLTYEDWLTVDFMDATASSRRTTRGLARANDSRRTRQLKRGGKVRLLCNSLVPAHERRTR